MTLERDERAVSIAVTHVLTIGITTILISGLLLGAGSMLENQREEATKSSLETIGERLASEITDVDRIASDGADNVTVRTDHQRFVTGSQYTVELIETGCASEYPLIDTEQCIGLTSNSEGVSVGVPLTTNQSIGGSVTGGAIIIEWDGGDITLEEEP
ncbi:DUF7266 family protein [Halovivax limisalsi]|uniref:DUF7266 family protein n=1 Tax=Halovivax limisalsi TaxID=1453760 RepID=UPI001FFCEAFF|nr:hypothetical protein [Halovivax limisalsi]